MGIFKDYIKSEKRYVYVIDYYNEHGVRVRESTKSGSHTFAKELLANRKDEVAKRKKLPDRYIPRVKFSDFVDNEYLPIHAKGHRTERSFKCIAEKLKSHFGDTFLHEIDALSIEKYKKGLVDQVAPNTINNALNTLSGIFTKAIEWGKATVNPVKGIKRFAIRERSRILDRPEQDALIVATTEEIRAPYLAGMVIFDLSTGLRVPSELLRIKWSDINFESQSLHVRAEIAKYGKDRHVDLNRHALKVLRSLPRYGENVFCKKNGEPFKRGIVRSFKSAAKRAGLKDVVIHDIRRTFGANCVMDGVDLATVQAWMGHASIETTIKHYGHLVKSHKKDAIKKIEGRMDTCMDTWLKSVKVDTRKIK